jgi:hypothetical protein
MTFNASMAIRAANGFPPYVEPCWKKKKPEIYGKKGNGVLNFEI